MSARRASEPPDRLRLVVASGNPVKRDAARRGFALAFPGTELEVETVSVESGVADQPMNDAETLRGAANRARAAERLAPEAHYWVGMEGGIAGLGSADGEDRDEGEDLMAFAWIVIRGQGRVPADAGTEDAATKGGTGGGEGAEGGSAREGRARTAAFPLPPPVTRLIRQGLELGAADDRVFGRTDSKKKQGAVGLLTGGLLDRAGLYEPAVVLALIPFLRPELY